METARFENELRQQGFDEIEIKGLAPETHNAAHHHAFDVKGLVLEGEIALTVAGERRTYRAGDIFTMAAGCDHREDSGAAGVRYLVGRRREIST